VATDHAHSRLADLSSLNPIRWRSSRRSRTKARSRRGCRKWKEGLTNNGAGTSQIVVHQAPPRLLLFRRAAADWTRNRCPSS
jgi:hypothetical protein